jgi:hypothetical protein
MAKKSSTDATAGGSPWTSSLIMKEISDKLTAGGISGKADPDMLAHHFKETFSRKNVRVHFVGVWCVF